MAKRSKSMTKAEFSDLCECVVKTGNTTHCMKLIGRPIEDLYRFLKKNSDERSRLTMARALYHDDFVSTVRDLALNGIPGFRRGERGKIVMGDDGEPLIDRSPNPQLLAAVMRDTANRLARAEQIDSESNKIKSYRSNSISLEDIIKTDLDPDLLDIGKK